MTEVPRAIRGGVCLACLLLLGLTSCGRVAVVSATDFDGERAYATLEAIVGVGPRPPGSDGSRRAREVIRREVEAAGLAVEEHAFTARTPLGAREMVNMVAVIEGTEPGVIVVGNHYDTKYFADFEFVGANDGGSTSAWMVELARTLGPRREGLSLWLCWFDGEEALLKWSAQDGLYGSREMVRRLEAEGTLEQVKAMVNVDMIGDCDLDIAKDAKAPAWMTKIFWGTAAEQGYTRHFTPRVDSVDDDHVPFREAGIPAMELIDYRYGGGRVEHQMNWHTSRDRLERVCAESLQVVGDVVLRSLDGLDAELSRN